MPDKENKFPQNIGGRFYVDDQCIACDACVIEAPSFFIMNSDEGHAFVFKQPINQTDEDICLKALESCPVEAIGLDGEGE